MHDVLRIAVGVATPLSLLGLIAALAYYIYSRRLKHREAIIKLLPEEARAKEVDELLSRYGLDAANLTREQKYQLLLDEMNKRHKLAQYKLVVSASAFVFCFSVAAYAFIRLGEPPAKTSGIQVDNSGSTVGRDQITNINPPVDTTKGDKILERGIPQDEHPVIDLAQPIEQQVQLFPEDKVKVVGWSQTVQEVWFGNRWEMFQEGRTYTVWGTEGQPVIPRFKGAGKIKLEISYTRYRDTQRDKRSTKDGPVYKK